MEFTSPSVDIGSVIYIHICTHMYVFSTAKSLSSQSVPDTVGPCRCDLRGRDPPVTRSSCFSHPRKVLYFPVGFSPFTSFPLRNLFFLFFLFHLGFFSRLLPIHISAQSSLFLTASKPMLTFRVLAFSCFHTHKMD